MFEADFLGFSFGRAFLEREVRQSRQALQFFISHCPEELFTQPKEDFSVSSDLKHLLGKSLLKGFPRIDDAADQLHMTKWTLIRKLRAEGTSYQELDYPGIGEFAVVGVADDIWGEVGCLFYVSERAAITPDAVADFLGSRLAKYKIPKKTQAIPSLPRNGVGKVLKAQLRAATS